MVCDSIITKITAILLYEKVDALQLSTQFSQHLRYSIIGTDLVKQRHCNTKSSM